MAGPRGVQDPRGEGPRDPGDGALLHGAGDTGGPRRVHLHLALLQRAEGAYRQDVSDSTFLPWR